MGTKYSTVTISGYNSSPPADDGSTAASNQVTWSKHKTKLGDPIKTAVESINSALVTALDYSSRSLTSNDSTVAGDNGRTIVIASTVTSAVTVSLMDAATAAAGYIVTIINESSVTCAVGRATASNTISGVTSDYSLPSLSSVTFVVSAAGSGYSVKSPAAVTLAGNQTIAGVKTFSSLPVFSAGVSAVNGQVYGWGDLSVSLEGNATTETLLIKTNAVTKIDIANGGVNGILFNPTQSASADANTLDDYEEGTWTPGVSFGGGTTGITYNTQSGSYTKIGNRVFFRGSINLSSKGSSTGSALITGLPFTNGEAHLVACSFLLNTLAAAIDAVPFAFVNSSASTVGLFMLANASSSLSPITDTQTNNTTDLYVAGNYAV